MGPARLRFASAIVVALGLTLAALSFTAGRDGLTPWGRPLGEDFSAFYDGSVIIAHHHAGRLYDQATSDALYHARFPSMAASTLPYVYPPFMAAALVPLSHLPFRWAWAAWLALNGALFAVGLAVLWRALGGRRGPVGQGRWPVLLACVAFEPWLFECWLGGQLSGLAFASISGAYALDRRHRPFTSGLILGACLYKPTLLVYIVPLLIVTRRWTTVAGVATTGAGLGACSIAAVGWPTTARYGHALVAHAHDTAGTGAIALRLWKFVDLNSFGHLLFGDTVVVTAAVAAVAAVTFVVLYRKSRVGGRTEPLPQLWWAAVIAATVSINGYVGVYDSTILVFAALLVFDAVWREPTAAERRRPVGAVLVVLWCAPWASPILARSIGWQLDTIAILAFFVVTVRLLAASGSSPRPADAPSAVT
jgi:hypothetical protein